MADPLIDDANAISTSSPKIRTFALHVAAAVVVVRDAVAALNARVSALDARVTALEAPPVVVPPTPAGKLWGISPGTPYAPALDVQAAVYVDLGATCPRISATDAAATAMLGKGIKHWFAWMDKSGTVAQAVAYLQKYPQCLGLELGNELNLDKAWTSQMVADQQKAFYAAAKAAGVESRVMLSSVGNDISKGGEALSMLDWCRSIQTKGAGLGKGFAIANYHNYGADPHTADLWQELWTVGRHGTCAQEVFGHPPFVVSEFGAKIGWADTPDAATQAAAATKWIAELSKQPDCLGGHWFLSHDGTAWAGFGLIDAAGNHRPAYAALKAAIAA